MTKHTHHVWHIQGPALHLEHAVLFSHISLLITHCSNTALGCGGLGFLQLLSIHYSDNLTNNVITHMSLNAYFNSLIKN